MEHGLVGMKRGKLFSVLAIILIVTTLAIVVTPVAAKLYYYRWGHWNLRYEHHDIPSHLRPYVEAVEYDLNYAKGKRYGVRLYLTWRGRILCSWTQPGGYYIAIMIARYVQTRPEWKGDRSLTSVYKEIRYHAPMFWDPGINIEYYYDDLPTVEKRLFGR